MNAVNLQMREELVAALQGVAEDPDVMVVVLTGAGRAFCSGLDHNGLPAGGGEERGPSGTAQEVRRMQRISLALQKMDPCKKWINQPLQWSMGSLWVSAAISHSPAI